MTSRLYISSCQVIVNKDVQYINFLFEIKVIRIAFNEAASDARFLLKSEISGIRAYLLIYGFKADI